MAENFDFAGGFANFESKEYFSNKFHMDSGCPCDFATIGSRKYENYENQRAKSDGTEPGQSTELPGVAKAATAIEPGELVVSTNAGSGGSGGGLETHAASATGADMVSGMTCGSSKFQVSKFQ